MSLPALSRDFAERLDAVHGRLRLAAGVGHTALPIGGGLEWSLPYPDTVCLRGSPDGVPAVLLVARVETYQERHNVRGGVMFATHRNWYPIVWAEGATEEDYLPALAAVRRAPRRADGPVTVDEVRGALRGFIGTGAGG